MTETAITQGVTSLTPITQAQAMLANASTPAEYRDLRDFATTAREWARARRLGVDAENQATEVILRAERELGKVVLAGREAGLIVRGSSQIVRADDLVKVEDITGFPSGDRISKAMIHLAEMPEDVFENALAAARESSERISKADLFRIAYPRERMPEVQREALAEVREAMQEDADPPVFTAWAQASDALMAAGPLPADVLARCAPTIRSLADWYNARRSELTA